MSAVNARVRRPASMTHRQRFRAALAGEPVDRTPAVLRLDLWHRAAIADRTLPQELAGQSIEQIQRDLGLGISARAARVATMRFLEPAEHRVEIIDDHEIETWSCPAGTLKAVRAWGTGDRQRGIRPATVRYPIQSLEDLDIFDELCRYRVYEPDFERYTAYDRAVGSDGLPMVGVGPIPVHELMVKWIGYENAFFYLVDNPDRFEASVAALDAAMVPLADILEASPCELILHGVNLDSAMTPPPIFRRYFLPYLQRFIARMHAVGKRVACHADGDMSQLLDLIVEAGFDVADCLACHPMTRLKFEDAWRAWRGRVTIWGGVPSTLLEEHVPEQHLLDHLFMMRDVVGEDSGLIFGLADQAMPGASWKRIRLLAERISEKR